MVPQSVRIDTMFEKLQFLGRIVLQDTAELRRFGPRPMTVVIEKVEPVRSLVKKRTGQRKRLPVALPIPGYFGLNSAEMVT